MTISTNATAGVAALNAANPNQLADALRAMGFGSFVRSMPVQRRSVALDGAAATNPYVVAAAQSITLPDDAKVGYLLAAYARAGTGTKGVLTVDHQTPEASGDAQPAAGHVDVAASGDLIFHAADAWTKVDLLYIPAKYDTKELTLPVVTNALTLPTQLGDAVALLEVEALVGTSVGKKIIDVVGTAVAAGHAAFSLDKLTVNFQATDAVTSARVKFGVKPALDLEKFLESAQAFY